MRRGEYARRGDYHKHLDRRWSYYSTYTLKMKRVRAYLARLPATAFILDVGCGEGILVEEYQKKGYGIWGTDLNYGSSYVIPGDIVDLPFCDSSFDVVLMLDIIGHLRLDQQTQALREIARVLKLNGELIACIPNLAHLNSRLRFLFCGRLHRTARITKHPGDRPIAEFNTLLEKTGFTIMSQSGLTPTIPFLVTRLLWKRPAQLVWLDAWLSRIFPSGLCFTNLIRARRGEDDLA